MKKLIRLFFLPLFLLLSVDAFSASSKNVTCDLNNEILPLLRAMAKDKDGLGKAIKDHKELLKVIKSLKEDNLTIYDHEVLLALIKMPDIDKGFPDWWDNKVTDEQAAIIWKHGKLKDSIENKLRYPGGFHEWCMVCKALTFKSWGITVDQIHEFRTDIKTGTLNWTVPDEDGYSNALRGKEGDHNGLGSTTFHNELKAIIEAVPNDGSNTVKFNKFKADLRELLDKWSVPETQWPDFIT